MSGTNLGFVKVSQTEPLPFGDALYWGLPGNAQINKQTNIQNHTQTYSLSDSIMSYGEKESTVQAVSIARFKSH